MKGLCNFCGNPAEYIAVSQGNNDPMYHKRSFVYKVCCKCDYTERYIGGEVKNMIILKIKKEIA